MAKNKKPQKNLLKENAVRRFMKLAEIDNLSNQFVTHHYLDEEDEADEVEAEVEAEVEEVPAEEEVEGEAEVAEMPEITPEAAQAIVDFAASLEASGAVENGAEEEAEVEEVPGEEEVEAEEEIVEARKGDKDKPGPGGYEKKAYGAPGKAEETESEKGTGRGTAYTTTKKGDKKKGGGRAYTNEQKDQEDLEEQLMNLGIEVIDDSSQGLKEAVYKRVIQRIVNEQKKHKKDQTINGLVENIFARIQKVSKPKK